MDHTDIYLGPEMAFGSPGAGPGTLSPSVWGGVNEPLTVCATGEQLFTTFVDVYC